MEIIPGGLACRAFACIRCSLCIREVDVAFQRTSQCRAAVRLALPVWRESVDEPRNSTRWPEPTS